MMVSVAVTAAANSRVRRFVLSMASLPTALVLLIAARLTITIAAWPLGLSSLVLVNAGNDLTIDQWIQMQQAAAASGCGLDWNTCVGCEGRLHPAGDSVGTGAVPRADAQVDHSRALAREREETRENAKVSATRTRTIRTGRH